LDIGLWSLLPHYAVEGLFLLLDYSCPQFGLYDTHMVGFEEICNDDWFLAPADSNVGTVAI
jgi:hypothetical protein